MLLFDDAYDESHWHDDVPVERQHRRHPHLKVMVGLRKQRCHYRLAAVWTTAHHEQGSDFQQIQYHYPPTASNAVVHQVHDENAQLKNYNELKYCSGITYNWI